VSNPCKLENSIRYDDDYCWLMAVLVTRQFLVLKLVSLL